MKKLTIILAALLLGAGIYLVLHVKPDKTTVVSKSNAQTPVTMPKQQPTPFPHTEYNYRPGDHLLYSLQYITDVQLEYTKDQNRQSSFGMEISGDLHQKIYKVGQQEVLVGYSVMQPVVKMTGAKEADIKKVQDAVSQEIYLQINKQGLIQTWFFPKNIPAADLNNIKSLLLLAQAILPAKAAMQWTTSEVDLNGAYDARYSVEATAQPDQLTLSKQKLGYTDAEINKTLTVNQNRAALHFTTNGYLLGLSLLEKKTIQAMGFVTKGSVQLELKLEQKVNEPALANSWDDKKLAADVVYSSTSFAPEGQKDLAQQRFIRLLGGMTWKDLNQELEQLKMADNPAKRFDLFRKLVALMELEVDKIATVTQKVLEEKVWGLNLATLISALGNVSHPQAQQALAEIIDKRQDSQEVMRMAIDTLGSVAHPTDESVQLVRKIYYGAYPDEIHSAASLSLGSIAKHLQLDNNSQAETIAYDLAKSLQQAKTAENKILLLESLGNASHVAALPHIKEYLDSPSDDLRATALMALRTIPDATVDNLLAEKLLTEPSPVIRGYALDAMSYRAPNQQNYTALSQRLEKEDTAELRIKQAQLLWKMRKDFPQAEALVRKFANSDASSKVRDAIQGFMLVD